MKILVIGSSGYVGGHVYLHAQNLGYETLGTRKEKRGTQEIVYNLLEHRIHDCLDKSFLETDDSLFGVICAGIANTDQCFREKEKSYEINVTNMIQLIDDLRELNIKPIYLSTSAVFNGCIGNYSDNDSYSPLSEYGRQKMTVEKYMRKVPEGLILRLDKVVDNSVASRNMFAEWYQLISENKPIWCIEDQLFTPTNVTDIAEGVILSCQKDLRGCYNLANTEVFLRSDLVKQFMLIMGQSTKLICKPAEEILNLLEPRGSKTFLDARKFIEATGINFTSMQEVIESIVKKMKEKESIENSV